MLLGAPGIATRSILTTSNKKATSGKLRTWMLKQRVLEGSRRRFSVPGRNPSHDLVLLFIEKETTA